MGSPTQWGMIVSIKIESGFSLLIPFKAGRLRSSLSLWFATIQSVPSQERSVSSRNTNASMSWCLGLRGSWYLWEAWDFFRAHLARESREAGQPFAELGRLADWLERAFDENRALLIPADQFLTGAGL